MSSHAVKTGDVDLAVACCQLLTSAMTHAERRQCLAVFKFCRSRSEALLVHDVMNKPHALVCRCCIIMIAPCDLPIDSPPPVCKVTTNPIKNIL